MRIFYLLIISIFLFNISYAQQTFNFYLPWDDATPSVIDLSYLNHKPAGVYGNVVIGTDNYLYVGTQRIKFLGMNFTGPACFPEHSTAEKIAKRLAKFGINIVRFHFLDNFWGYNIFDTSYNNTRNLSSTALDKLDYFVAKLKENGIYSNINLLVGRNFKSGDGLPTSIDTMDWKDKQTPAMFYPAMIDLQKEYASKLLNRTNPYTGTSYLSDPAIAFIEITNEHGLIHAWLGGAIDRLPIEFSNELKSQWNDWLVNKYTNHTNLVASGWSLQEPLGEEMLKNNVFSAGFAYWNREQHHEATANFTITPEGPQGENSVKIQVTNTGAQSWYIQFNQGGLTVSTTRPYTLTFYAKADRNIDIYVNIGQAHPPWQLLGFNKLLNLTTYYKQFNFQLVVSDNDTNARVNFTDMCKQTATYWFSNISFKPGGSVGLFPEENLNTRSIRVITFSEREQRTQTAQKDWVRFLWGTEEKYWLTMYNYLKTTLGVKSLVIGTALCSTPNIMNKLDVVDSHSYWHHPVFPGRPWDPNNWYVKNATLVKDRQGGTITALSSERVYGKPFTVTEYNHPAPNTYSSEAFIFLSAYASLQDWDGIYGYTYTHSIREDSRRITGYFDLDQHPTQFATFIPAACIFRRGDVSRANSLVTVNLNKNTEIEKLMTSWAWELVDAKHVGMPREASLLHRTAIVPEGTLTPLGSLTTAQVSIPANNNFSSDTNELNWDTANGVFTVNTSSTKVVLGYVCNKEYNLGGIIIRPKSSLQNWSCITMTLLQGKSFTSLVN